MESLGRRGETGHRRQGCRDDREGSGCSRGWRLGPRSRRGVAWLSAVALGLDDLILLRRLSRRGSPDCWTAAELLQLPEGEAAARLVSLRERSYLAARGRGRGTHYRLAPRHAGVVDAAVPTEDDVRVGEESARLRLIALVVNEMNRDREAVTVTNRGRPVAVLSPVPASEETHSAFVGMMRGTVARYRSAQRGPCMDQFTPRVVQSFCEDPVLHRGRPPPFRRRW